MLGEVIGCGASERSVGTDDIASGRLRRGRSRLMGVLRRRAGGEERGGVLSGTVWSGVWSIKVIAFSTVDSIGGVGVSAVSRRLTLAGDGVSLIVSSFVDCAEPVIELH